MTLSNPSGATLGTPSTAVLTIVDDGSPPVLAAVTVTATGGAFSPDPAPVGTQVQATLTAQATRPTVDDEYTMGAPTWAWSLLNGQYTCPPIITSLTMGIYGTDYSYYFAPAPAPPSDDTSDYSAVFLCATFTTPGIWQMNANVQVNYTDSGNGTYQGAAQAQANGTGWDVDKILRSHNGTSKFVPLDQGNQKFTLPGSFIVVKPRVIPNTVTATSYLWDMPPATTFKNYETSRKEGKLTLLADGDLTNEELKFYWADTGEKTVNCKVTVGQQSKSKSGALVVDAPTATFDVKVGKVYITTESLQLRLGKFDKDTQSKRGGMDFDGKVEVPAGYEEGEWHFTQLIKDKIFAWNAAGVKFKYMGNSTEFIGDMTPVYPVPKGAAATVKTPNPIATADTPYVSLKAWPGGKVQRSASWETYVMFKPAGTASQYVPLKKLDWAFSGTATWNAKTGKWDLSGETAPPLAPKTAPVDWSIHPEWNRLYQDAGAQWAPALNGE